ncbi:hypothetical protein ACH5RR_001404 [Cinchona calisaya]|uniref:Uncharacterized protein n=1 Tax=Cinchona calisaya TaxID=153742 RepID=A0ABD3B434_9GENT
MQLTSQNQSFYSKRCRNRVFTPLLKSLSQIFIDLHATGKLEPLPPGVERTPSKRRNADQICAFHSNIPGHATDKCHALRHEVQDLIDKSEFIPLMDVDPSINMILVEESSNNPSELSYPRREIPEIGRKIGKHAIGE